MTITNFSELQSKTINFLRFPLMLMVVFIHDEHLEINMQILTTKTLQMKTLYTIIVNLGHYTLTQIAVPCFFMFSGFLFFYKTTEFSKTQYFDKLKKRIKTLLIPYLLWNILAICVPLAGALKNGELATFWTNLSEKGFFSIFLNYTSWKSMTGQIYFGPALLPLWFLRDLILTVILSPVIYHIVKYTKILGIIGLGLLYYFKIGVIIVDYNLNQLVVAIFFFALGSYFSINEKNIISSLRKVQIFGLPISLISLGFSVYFYQTDIFQYILPIYVVSGIITIVNITSLLIERNKIKEIDLLSKASFFIYLSHTILILGLSRVFLNKIIPFDNYIALTIIYLLTPFLCVSVCVALYFLLHKFLPKLTEIIVGGR